MPIHVERKSVSTLLASAARLAWPDARAKRMARELGCSIDTAKRILASGNVSGRLRGAYVQTLISALETIKSQIEYHENALRGIAYEEMVSRAGARRAAPSRRGRAPVAGASDGRPDPALDLFEGPR